MANHQKVVAWVHPDFPKNPCFIVAMPGHDGKFEGVQYVPLVPLHRDPGLKGTPPWPKAKGG